MNYKQITFWVESNIILIKKNNLLSPKLLCLFNSCGIWVQKAGHFCCGRVTSWVFFCRNKRKCTLNPQLIKSENYQWGWREKTTHCYNVAEFFEVAQYCGAEVHPVRQARQSGVDVVERLCGLKRRSVEFKSGLWGTQEYRVTFHLIGWGNLIPSGHVILGSTC